MSAQSGNPFPTTLILMEISSDNLAWADHYYPQYSLDTDSEKRSEQFRLGRALLHHALIRIAGVAQTDLRHIIEFQYGEHGRPFLASPYQNIYFNLSHTDRSVALVIGQSPAIGVDIEQIKPRRFFDRLLTRTFTEKEQRWIQHAPNFKAAFFMLWSGKEAYLKADGSGLSRLAELEFDPLHHSMHGPLEIDLSRTDHHPDKKLMFKNNYLLYVTILNEDKIEDKKAQSLALLIPEKEAKSLQILGIKKGAFAPFKIDWRHQLQSD